LQSVLQQSLFRYIVNELVLATACQWKKNKNAQRLRGNVLLDAIIWRGRAGDQWSPAARI